MDDLISRQAAIDVLERSKDKTAKGDIGGFYNTIIQNDIDKIKGLPSAEPDGKIMLDKEAILQAGYQGREVDFRIGGRLFAIREKAQ